MNAISDRDPPGSIAEVCNKAAILDRVHGRKVRGLARGAALYNGSAKMVLSVVALVASVKFRL
jgi:hypothetical protein